MHKELQELQNTPASCELHTVQRVRVYASGAADADEYQELAGHLEASTGVRGSSVQLQQGRWHGVIEDGAVIEICVPTDKFNHVGLTRRLRKLRDGFNLTFYVTMETVTAMEVF